MKKHKLLTIILFAIILSLLGILNVYAQTLGCCSNPGADIFTCLFNGDVFQSDCCPVSGYDTDADPRGPTSQTNCESDFFQQNIVESVVCDSGIASPVVDACTEQGCCCKNGIGSTSSLASCTGTNSEFIPDDGSTNFFSCSMCVEVNGCINGVIMDASLTPPLNSLQDGVCSGSVKVCGLGGWVDDYSSVANYEVNELSCDDLDNDCNGSKDEVFPDTDTDGTADCVDTDDDNDGVLDIDDNCPFTSNPLQEDFDNNGSGDVCEPDNDNDQVLDSDELSECLFTPLGENVNVDGCSCSQLTCDDTNLCTDDSCNPTTVTCEYVIDDTNSCGVGMECTQGLCIIPQIEAEQQSFFLTTEENHYILQREVEYDPTTISLDLEEQPPSCSCDTNPDTKDCPDEFPTNDPVGTQCNDYFIVPQFLFGISRGYLQGVREYLVEGIINSKDLMKYGPKESFLISDKSWKDILPLVPVTTWTGNEFNCKRGYGTADNICIYPTLIYHEENNLFFGEPITTDLSSQTSPSISGDVIVWQDFRNGNSDIYMYDISTQTETQITINPSSQTSPSISGDVIVWGGNRNGNFDIYKYNEEGIVVQSFDADSIIYFMQQYNTDKVTIIGNTPQELDNLLVAAPELGAGLIPEQIQRINTNDYFSYWESYNDIVYVEDNYELALLASTYASLINAPLVIQGTSSDTANIFSGKNVICIGSAIPAGSSCTEKYNLEQLQQKYVDETNTDKIILVNPNDLDIEVVEKFTPEKSTNSINELYSKTSLAAPILASAKHELIIPISSIDYPTINTTLKSKIQTLFTPPPQFLTIIAAPNAIQMRQYMYTSGIYDIHRALDHQVYSDLDDNLFDDPDDDSGLDISTGRIMGMTLSDVSGYIARDLFYNSFVRTNNMKFMATGLPSMPEYYYVVSLAINLANSFSSVGYNALSNTYDDYTHNFNPVQWQNQDLISYQDHGTGNWAGIYSREIPLLKNSIVFNDACSTCATYNQNSFCNRAIRQGALAHIGNVGIAFTHATIHVNTMNGIYYENLTVGEAFRKYYARFMTILVGDPTLDLNPPYMLNEPLLFS